MEAQFYKQEAMDNDLQTDMCLNVHKEFMAVHDNPIHNQRFSSDYTLRDYSLSLEIFSVVSSFHQMKRGSSMFLNPRE